MAAIRAFKIVVLFAVVHVVLTETQNGTLKDVNKNIKHLETRKKGKRSRSTSSSSGSGKDSNSGTSGLSLGLSTSDSASSEKEKRSGERTGWKKWHRKCTPCLEDARLKWRDPRIRWICGAYQRARRSFKSNCMMYYRNCQDGTMFVKIHDGRCTNDTSADEKPHGEHFFYDYKAQLSDDRSNSKSSSDSDISSSSSDD